MRIFIAIELDEHLKGYIFDKQQTFKGYCEKGRFTSKENFHLTLKFIGQTNNDEIELLKEAIDKTAEYSSTFNLKLGKLGYFPKKNRKIVWLGISQGKSKLLQLFETLEINLEVKGFERDTRGLNPHITLAREVALNTDYNEISRAIKILDYDIPVKKISLMESKRVDGELKYIPIYTKDIKNVSNIT